MSAVPNQLTGLWQQNKPGGQSSCYLSLCADSLMLLPACMPACLCVRCSADPAAHLRMQAEQSARQALLQRHGRWRHLGQEYEGLSPEEWTDEELMALITRC